LRRLASTERESMPWDDMLILLTQFTCSVVGIATFQWHIEDEASLNLGSFSTN
jgi:hypothetical protein